MKVLLANATLQGILLLASPFLAAQNTANSYKIDAVTPDGIIIRHAGGAEWVDAPLSDPGKRERILSGIAPELLAESPVVQQVATSPQSGPDGTGSFVYDPSRLSSGGRAAVVLKSIESAYVAEKREEVIRYLPGAASPRELPWEFVSNEIAMLALWFYHADESDPTNATISDYIREQHAPGTAVSPPALLYRLLIRPWLKKEK